MDELTTSQVLDLCGFAPDVLDRYDVEITQAAPVRKVVRFTTPHGQYALKKFNLSPKNCAFRWPRWSMSRKKGSWCRAC
ncbi:hypothetical protein CBW65_21730 [Tumebacillus avium]|uniref:Uncharacterized protein n=1 Tax=Tumebacillus avium TaxID=1903704 RepID=A0A1Y0IRP7_9BACL|nr:hypothetical protein [Tumebacillus avium]ARU63312.1 hypothetical protein CBW65_21730 [Tumebacillus avium]